MSNIHARETQRRHHFASTVRSLIGDNVDSTLIFAIIVAEVATISETVLKILIKHPHDLRCIQVLVRLARTKVQNKLSLQFRVEAKEAIPMLRLIRNHELPLVCIMFGGREDEESPDVIAGTVELNSHSAYALIDFGSTHSFICTTTLDRLSMKPEIVKTSLVVSNPIGKNMPINLICKESPITIRGIPFPIDLYVLPNYRKPTPIFAAMALQDEYDFGLPAMPLVSEFIDVFPE
ncbi:hypothetical protein V6N13_008332 [Hibiscus sabdariffa]